MLKFAINPISETCPFCQNPRNVVFTYADDVLSVVGASYHHENGDLLRFAENLRALEQSRVGKTTLLSQAEDSEFVVWIARTGGDLRFAAKQLLRHDADADLTESVTYFGVVESEHVGQFLGEWISKIEMCQPSASPNGGPAKRSDGCRDIDGPPSVS